MPLNKSTQALTEQLKKASLKPLSEMTAKEYRRLVDSTTHLSGEKHAVEKIEQKEIFGPNGSILIKIYTPIRKKTNGAIVFFNGSGFAYGSIETHDVLCRDIANVSGTKLIAVAYRSAPENPYPKGLHDAIAATKWVKDHAVELEIDQDEIGVMGESSGGNFAALTAIHARDEGWPLAFQVLIVPVVDLSCSFSSYQKYGKGYLLDKEDIQWYFQQYLPKTCDLKDPKISPYWVENLVGLPPTLIIAAECDPLCDEGKAYAERLKKANVFVKYSCYQGQIHHMNFLRGMLKGEKDSVIEIGAVVQEFLNHSA